MEIKAWLGQTTTGAGFAALLGCLSGVAGGAVSWHQALPLLAGAIAALIWPENTQLKTTAEDTVGDIEKLVTAYRIGLRHGAAGAPDGTTVPTPNAVLGTATQSVAAVGVGA